ncbi:conserved hypothetical protein [Histoplasma capsulatum var. duboisii H88]|uniref:Uncharacterized protein n=1 Tax=Ajellomyces capsulatus (strain H88) TaxID=544711 RepID=F0UBM7_AJEC8|nr:conserved hypothetical protein [Histoplasma capsulatum var. duboisii H88]
MYEIDDPDLQKEKCYTTIGKLPPFVDPRQPPVKKCPFSSISKHPFVHSTSLILPKEIYDSVWDSISSRIQTPQYAKVIMPLSVLVERDFFNCYIKIGDVLLISEGRSGVDNVYTLHNGVLRLELDKNSFERAGLDGKPIRSGGRKHVKERYAVEINLRLPSMLHGKKGFERIVWAFKNVLTTSVTWLFCDLTQSPTYSEEDAPIKKHYPQILQCTPEVNILGSITVPPLFLSGLETGTGLEFLHETCDEIQEWLGLVFLNSPPICIYIVSSSHDFAVCSSGGRLHCKPEVLVNCPHPSAPTSESFNRQFIIMKTCFFFWKSANGDQQAEIHLWAFED